MLRDTWSLYRRLLQRSVGLSVMVFGAIELVRAGMANTPGIAPLTAALAGAALSLVGTSLVQGALAESVRDVHVGAEPAGILGSYERAVARLGSLVGVSVLSALGITLGFVCLIVPGVVLMARWAVAVPVVMYEGATPIAALRRSNELVRGHGRAVLTVVVNVAVRVGVVGFAFGTVTQIQGSFLAAWVGLTVGATLTTPYAAHSLSVLYYRLTEPNRPLIAEPGSRWHSVWHEGEPGAPNDRPALQAQTLDEEYARKLDERSKQWGG